MISNGTGLTKKFLTNSFKNIDLIDKFIQTNKHLNPIIESNERTNDSYLMVSPNGKFFQNSFGEYYYSDSILKIGVRKAFEQIKFSFDNFKSRGAEYYRKLII